MKITNEYVFFWSGFLSQWTAESFSELGVTFNCCEQYMMWRKAILFKDYKVAELIINETDPSKIKQLGRRVKNYDEYVWSKHKYEIVITGNHLRFSQNPKSRDKLLSYSAKVTFVEASPYDKIWGIGMDENHPDINNSTKWKGENLLGKALTDVRDSFIKEIR